jgi:DNA-binding MarR family transcriptional regulator
MSEPIAFRVMNEIGIIDQLGSTLFERSMPFDLTLPQFTVLNHFVRLGDGRTPVELASAFQVTKATITSTLQRLERKGFVKSTPDANDGRSKRITITASGRKARDRSIKAIEHHLAALETAVGKRHLEAVVPVLTALRTFLDRQRDGD